MKSSDKVKIIRNELIRQPDKVKYDPRCYQMEQEITDVVRGLLRGETLAEIQQRQSTEMTTQEEKNKPSTSKQAEHEREKAEKAGQKRKYKETVAAVRKRTNTNGETSTNTNMRTREETTSTSRPRIREEIVRYTGVTFKWSPYQQEYDYFGEDPHAPAMRPGLAKEITSWLVQKAKTVKKNKTRRALRVRGRMSRKRANKQRNKNRNKKTKAKMDAEQHGERAKVNENNK